jgi:hypothetical protein
MVRAGGPLRTARAIPAPTASFGGRGHHAFPQLSPAILRLEKRGAVAALIYLSLKIAQTVTWMAAEDS